MRWKRPYPYDNDPTVRLGQMIGDALVVLCSACRIWVKSRRNALQRKVLTPTHCQIDPRYQSFFLQTAERFLRQPRKRSYSGSS
jgi:hypothetical protein